jgi:hypothetical protein
LRNASRCARRSFLLQVALDPASIARQFVHQRRRRFFIALRQPGLHPDLVARPAHIGCLHEIMAHDRSPEETDTGQLAQAAVPDERLDAQDGVMPPVHRLAQLKGGETGAEQRAVEAIGELLESSEGRTGVDQRGVGLKDTHLRLKFHVPHHPHQRLAAHYAVGIKHDHVLVIISPATQEIGDITALVAQVDRAAAVEQVILRIQFLAQAKPGRLLGEPDVGIAAVRQDMEIEMLQLSGGLERAEYGPCPTERSSDRLVVDGQQDRGAGQRSFRQPLHTVAARERVRVPSETAHDEPEHRGPESDRNPGKEYREQHHQSLFHAIAAVIGKHGYHEITRHDGLRQYEQRQENAAYDRHGTPLHLHPGGHGMTGLIGRTHKGSVHR